MALPITQEQQLKAELNRLIREAIRDFESRTPYRVESIDVEGTRKGDEAVVTRDIETGSL